jgi:TM2 domain-containing membrane protein YozV
MFSAKELNLEETELREQAALLDAGARQQLALLEQRSRRSPQVYLSLNLLFFLGAQHFYLGRWGRGAITLTAGLVSLNLLVASESLYGIGLLLAMGIIEIPQLLNYELIVHAYNNRSLRRNMQRLRKSLR